MAKRSDNKGRKGPGNGREEREFEQRLVDIARVTRVKAGGKRLSFRALIVIGDKKGRVGAGVAKGADVSIAVEKAVAQAKKNLVQVPMVGGTIAHEISEKFKASKVFLKPAKPGRGIIAGGAVRQVLDLAGFTDVVSKIRGSSSKINNTRATINALKKLKRVEVREDSKKEKSEEKGELKKQENKKAMPIGRQAKKQDDEKEEEKDKKEREKLSNKEIKDGAVS